MRKSKRERAISDVIAEQPPLNATVLWKFARDDFSEWIRLGMGEADSYGGYLRRLKEAGRVAEEQELAVIYCTKSPIEVAAWMLSEDLDPTNPEHRAVAIGVMSHDN